MKKLLPIIALLVLFGAGCTKAQTVKGSYDGGICINEGDGTVMTDTSTCERDVYLGVARLPSLEERIELLERHLGPAHVDCNNRTGSELCTVTNVATRLNELATKSPLMVTVKLKTPIKKSGGSFDSACPPGEGLWGCVQREAEDRVTTQTTTQIPLQEFIDLLDLYYVPATSTEPVRHVMSATSTPTGIKWSSSPMTGFAGADNKNIGFYRDGKLVFSATMQGWIDFLLPFATSTTSNQPAKLVK